MESEIELIHRAVKDVIRVDREYRGRGRKPHDVHIMVTLTYLMIRNGWSLREAVRWCRENMDLLRRVGYDMPNPPSRMAFKRTLDTLDPATIQRITAKVKYLRGELRILWF